FPVLGFDVDSAKVLKLLGGQSYIGHIPADIIREMREKGFEATDQFERLCEVDAVLICVPTPLTEAREPDLGDPGNVVDRNNAQGSAAIGGRRALLRIVWGWWRVGLALWPKRVQFS